MSSAKSKIQKIQNNKIGVNSGVYSAIDQRIHMMMNERGEYEPVLTEDLTEDTYKKLLAVDMMSDESANETTLAVELFARVSGIKHDDVIGYYTDLYVGHVTEGSFRKNGSSGGFTSWIIAELLRTNKIDAVIHAQQVAPNKNQGRLFKYAISRTKHDVLNGAKSRYYPLELSEVIRAVKKKTGRYAVVGIPEFITELRLLAKQDTVVAERLVYMIGLVCGHQKSANYTAALAWEQGIKPGDLQSVDYRVKQKDSTATDYLHKFSGMIDGKKVSFTKTHAELYAENWGAGFFKSKFSDFTDNVFNETADVVLGDAWLPEYEHDGMGNNIVITRNQEISDIIKDGIRRKKIRVQRVMPDDIKESQQGLIHHVRDELPYRLFINKKRGGWVPRKRVEPSPVLDRARKKVQLLRKNISEMSHEKYLEAVSRDDWMFFQQSMEKPFSQYRDLYKKLRSGEKFTNRIRRKIRPRTRIKSMRHRFKAATNPYKNATGAIVTLTGYFNYGNILQRYALQKFLKQKGLNFISYAREELDENNIDMNRFLHTVRFVNHYIWRKSFEPSDNFPCYIVGSDQVWRNWEYADEQKELGYYFLDFVTNPETKKIGYALSFGQETARAAMISKGFESSAQNLVDEFDALSVREKSAATIINKSWGKSAVKVVDPVMLLKKSDYDTLIKNSPTRLDDVQPIFTYIIAADTSKEKAVDVVAKKTKLQVSRLHPKKVEQLPPVEQWLKGFRDAGMVVTDSFHGTVLSIINNTPFLVIENEYGGVTRIESLLDEFGLSDRLMSTAQIDTLDVSSLKPIKWASVNKKLDELRDESGTWLMDAIQKEKG